jgi:hypothetical protein
LNRGDKNSPVAVLLGNPLLGGERNQMKQLRSGNR